MIKCRINHREFLFELLANDWELMVCPACGEGIEWIRPESKGKYPTDEESIRIYKDILKRLEERKYRY